MQKLMPVSRGSARGWERRRDNRHNFLRLPGPPHRAKAGGNLGSKMATCR
jgi:hypothetical protein